MSKGVRLHAEAATAQLSLRVPVPVLTRLDKALERAQKVTLKSPRNGVGFVAVLTRSDLLRLVVERGLTALEDDLAKQEYKTRKGARRA